MPYNQNNQYQGFSPGLMDRMGTSYPQQGNGYQPGAQSGFSLPTWGQGPGVMPSPPEPYAGFQVNTGQPVLGDPNANLFSSTTGPNGPAGAGLFNGQAPGFMRGMTGGTDDRGNYQTGWGGLAFNAASGLANTYLGMQQYGLAKDTFKQNKREFAMNWGANKALTNARLEDRQRARVATGNSAYQSVSAYMAKNGIK